MRTAVLMLCAVLWTSAAQAQEPEPIALEVDGFLNGVRASGWSLLGAPIELELTGATSAIWGVTRDDVGGVVAFYRCEDDQRADRLVKRLDGEGTAFARQGDVVVAVILDGQPTPIATKMLDRIMDVATGRHLDANAAFATMLGAMVEEVEVLPEVRFGSMNRAEVLEAALRLGWMPQQAPRVLNAQGYDAVTYTLTRAGEELSLTLYQCHVEADARAMAASLRKQPDANVITRNAAVIVAVGKGAPTIIQSLGRP